MFSKKKKEKVDKPRVGPLSFNANHKFGPTDKLPVIPTGKVRDFFEDLNDWRRDK